MGERFSVPRITQPDEQSVDRHRHLTAPEAPARPITPPIETPHALTQNQSIPTIGRREIKPTLSMPNESPAVMPPARANLTVRPGVERPFAFATPPVDLFAHTHIDVDQLARKFQPQPHKELNDEHLTSPHAQASGHPRHLEPVARLPIGTDGQPNEHRISRPIVRRRPEADSTTAPTASPFKPPTEGGGAPTASPTKPPTEGGHPTPRPSALPTEGGHPTPHPSIPPTEGGNPTPHPSTPPTEGGKPTPHPSNSPTEGGHRKPGPPLLYAPPAELHIWHPQFPPTEFDTAESSTWIHITNPFPNPTPEHKSDVCAPCNIPCIGAVPRHEEPHQKPTSRPHDHATPEHQPISKPKEHNHLTSTPMEHHHSAPIAKEHHQPHTSIVPITESKKHSQSHSLPQGLTVLKAHKHLEITPRTPAHELAPPPQNQSKEKHHPHHHVRALPKLDNPPGPVDSITAKPAPLDCAPPPLNPAVQPAPAVETHTTTTVEHHVKKGSAVYTDLSLNSDGTTNVTVGKWLDRRNYVNVSVDAGIHGLGNTRLTAGHALIPAYNADGTPTKGTLNVEGSAIINTGHTYDSSQLPIDGGAGGGVSVNGYRAISGDRNTKAYGSVDYVHTSQINNETNTQLGVLRTIGHVPVSLGIEHTTVTGFHPSNYIQAGTSVNLDKNGTKQFFLNATRSLNTGKTTVWGGVTISIK